MRKPILDDNINQLQINFQQKKRIFGANIGNNMHLEKTFFNFHSTRNLQEQKEYNHNKNHYHKILSLDDSIKGNNQEGGKFFIFNYNKKHHKNNKIKNEKLNSSNQSNLNEGEDYVKNSNFSIWISKQNNKNPKNKFKGSKNNLSNFNPNTSAFEVPKKGSKNEANIKFDSIYLDSDKENINSNIIKISRSKEIIRDNSNTNSIQINIFKEKNIPENIQNVNIFNISLNNIYKDEDKILSKETKSNKNFFDINNKMDIVKEENIKSKKTKVESNSLKSRSKDNNNNTTTQSNLIINPFNINENINPQKIQQLAKEGLIIDNSFPIKDDNINKFIFNHTTRYEDNKNIFNSSKFANEDFKNFLNANNLNNLILSRVNTHGSSNFNDEFSMLNKKNSVISKDKEVSNNNKINSYIFNMNQGNPNCNQSNNNRFFSLVRNQTEKDPTLINNSVTNNFNQMQFLKQQILLQTVSHNEDINYYSNHNSKILNTNNVTNFTFFPGEKFENSINQNYLNNIFNLNNTNQRVNTNFINCDKNLYLKQNNQVNLNYPINPHIDNANFSLIHNNLHNFNRNAFCLNKNNTSFIQNNVCAFNLSKNSSGIEHMKSIDQNEKENFHLQINSSICLNNKSINNILNHNNSIDLKTNTQQGENKSYSNINNHKENYENIKKSENALLKSNLKEKKNLQINTNLCNDNFDDQLNILNEFKKNQQSKLNCSKENDYKLNEEFVSLNSNPSLCQKKENFEKEYFICEYPNPFKNSIILKQLKKSPQILEEYLPEFHHCLKNEEKKLKLNLQNRKLHIEVTEKMRLILVSWLTEVHKKFRLLDETLYLTIHIIDFCLHSKESSWNKANFQLLGISSMLLACKYEEIYYPEIKDFYYVTDKAFSVQQILECEFKICKILDYLILTCYPIRFLELYRFIFNINDSQFFFCKLILEISLMDSRFLEFDKSLITLAAVFVMGKSMDNKFESFQFDFYKELGNRKNEFKECARLIGNHLDNSLDTDSFRIIKERYVKNIHRLEQIYIADKLKQIHN